VQISSTAKSSAVGDVMCETLTALVRGPILAASSPGSQTTTVAPTNSQVRVIAFEHRYGARAEAAVVQMDYLRVEEEAVTYERLVSQGLRRVLRTYFPDFSRSVITLLPVAAWRVAHLATPAAEAASAGSGAKIANMALTLDDPLSTGAEPSPHPATTFGPWHGPRRRARGACRPRAHR